MQFQLFDFRFKELQVIQLASGKLLMALLCGSTCLVSKRHDHLFQPFDLGL